MSTRRSRLALAGIAFTALALAGCSSSGGSESAGAGGGADSAADYAEGGAEAGPVAMDPTETQTRHVIITASAAVVVDDPAAVADQVAALVEVGGGRVEGREEWAGADDGEGSARLVVRVPSAELSGLLDDLDELGEVQTITQSQEDVTGAVQDLDARIAALETSTDRLLEIMASASDTDDLLATEAKLSERQAELESLQAQRDSLGDAVAMATLTVTLDAEAPAPVVARGGFIGGLESGWTALVAFASALLVAVGAMLPWIVALGVPALVVIVVLRRRRRRASLAT